MLLFFPGDSCEAVAVAGAVLGAKALILALILAEGLLGLVEEDGAAAAAAEDGGGDEACCGPPCCHSFTIDATRPGDADVDAGLL